MWFELSFRGVLLRFVIFLILGVRLLTILIDKSLTTWVIPTTEVNCTILSFRSGKNFGKRGKIRRI